MDKALKNHFLQIRISSFEKKEIQRRAKLAHMDMSEWVLRKALPSGQKQFQSLIDTIEKSQAPSYPLAELSDFLSSLEGVELEQVCSEKPIGNLSPFLANHIAAMVEYVCAQKGIKTPQWVDDVEPLKIPHFASSLLSLRLYLLTSALPPFRRRNIFADASIGNRI